MTSESIASHTNERPTASELTDFVNAPTKEFFATVVGCTTTTTDVTDDLADFAFDVISGCEDEDEHGQVHC